MRDRRSLAGWYPLLSDAVSSPLWGCSEGELLPASLPWALPVELRSLSFNAWSPAGCWRFGKLSGCELGTATSTSSAPTPSVAGIPEPSHSLATRIRSVLEMPVTSTPARPARTTKQCRTQSQVQARRCVRSKQNATTRGLLAARTHLATSRRQQGANHRPSRRISTAPLGCSKCRSVAQSWAGDAAPPRRC